MTGNDSVRIDYVEFASPRFEETQGFLAAAFGWRFVDYGPDYRGIEGAGLDGGIERAALQPPLVILRHDDLEAMRERVLAAGAEMTRDIYAFPGGRRFEFREPGGTRMAVWSET